MSIWINGFCVDIWVKDLPDKKHSSTIFDSIASLLQFLFLLLLSPLIYIRFSYTLFQPLWRIHCFLFYLQDRSPVTLRTSSKTDFYMAGNSLFNYNFMRFEVLAALKRSTQVCWEVTPCGCGCVCRKHPEDGDSMLLRKRWYVLQVYTALRPRKPTLT